VAFELAMAYNERPRAFFVGCGYEIELAFNGISLKVLIVAVWFRVC